MFPKNALSHCMCSVEIEIHVLLSCKFFDALRASSKCEWRTVPNTAVQPICCRRWVLIIQGWDWESCVFLVLPFTYCSVKRSEEFLASRLHFCCRTQRNRSTYIGAVGSLENILWKTFKTAWWKKYSNKMCNSHRKNFAVKNIEKPCIKHLV